MHFPVRTMVDILCITNSYRFSSISSFVYIPLKEEAGGGDGVHSILFFPWLWLAFLLCNQITIISDWTYSPLNVFDVTSHIKFLNCHWNSNETGIVSYAFYVALNVKDINRELWMHWLLITHFFFESELKVNDFDGCVIMVIMGRYYEYYDVQCPLYFCSLLPAHFYPLMTFNCSPFHESGGNWMGWQAHASFPCGDHPQINPR